MSVRQISNKAGEKSSITVSWEKRTQAGSFGLLVVTSFSKGWAQPPKRWKTMNAGGAHLPFRTQVFKLPRLKNNEDDVVVKFNSEGYYVASLLELVGPTDGGIDVVASAKGVSDQATSPTVATSHTNEDWIGIVANRNNNAIRNLPIEGWTQLANPRSGGGRGGRKVGHSIFFQAVTSAGNADVDKQLDIPDGEQRPWVATIITITNDGTKIGRKLSGTSLLDLNALGDITSSSTVVEPGVHTDGGLPTVFPVSLDYAQDKLYVAGGLSRRKVWYTEDGASWNEVPFLFSAPILAIAGDHEYLYVWEHRPSSQRLFRISNRAPDESASSVPWNNELIANTESESFPLGLTVQGGFLYRWTGSQLYRYLTALVPLDLPLKQDLGGEKVYDTGIDPRVFGMVGDIVATDTSVVFFTATGGKTTVYEYESNLGTDDPGAARPIWNMPRGFTGRAICYHLGAIWVAGDYEGEAQVWAMNLAQKIPFHAVTIRPEDNHTVRAIAPGQGSQILIATSSSGSASHVWVYDAAIDAISILGDASTAGTAAALATFLNRRILAITSGGNLFAERWEKDTNIEANQTTWVLEDSAYDFDIPHEEKILSGFHLTFSPLAADQSLQVAYQFDEDGDWINTTAISIANGDTAGITHKFVPISVSGDTKKFRHIRVRVTGTHNIVLYSWVVEAITAQHLEIWEMLIRLKDEMPDRRADPAEQRRAEDMRDSLVALARSGNIVSFKDGYRYKHTANKFTTHEVVVEAVDDQIRRGSEGFMRIRLRSSQHHES